MAIDAHLRLWCRIALGVGPYRRVRWLSSPKDQGAIAPTRASQPSSKVAGSKICGMGAPLRGLPWSLVSLPEPGTPLRLKRRRLLRASGARLADQELPSSSYHR
jgi:hypothetical protein